MPTIIGIPAGKMICTSSSASSDNLGLVRLTENYAFATSEIATFRTRLKNLTTHKDVMAFVHPAPTTLFPLVTIESSDITEESGGISTASVNYTGILVTASSANLYNTPLNTSWLPPAIQRLQPFAAGFNPVQVIVDFIYYSPLPNPDQSIIKDFGFGAPLPSSINGTPLYQSLVQPFTREIEDDAESRKALRREGAPTRPSGSNVREEYYGMRCVSHFSEKIGLFFKVTNTYQDSYSYSSAQTGFVLYGVYPPQFGRT
jgi:hypothetical protein